MSSSSVSVAEAGDRSDAGLGAQHAADRAMARYAEGEQAAFDEVFALLAGRLQRFLRRLAGSQALADDLLQETLLKMHQARGHFTPGMPVTPWAYAIARNCYLDAARATRRRPLVFEADEQSSSETAKASADADAEQQLIAQQSARMVERALANMTLMRREAFVLLRYEGLSVAAAAEILGASESAVKLRAFQAYKLIREELARSDAARKK